MKRILIVIGLLLDPRFTFANVYAQWGVAIDHPAGQTYSAVKYAELGMNKTINKFNYVVGIGGWTDITGYQYKGRTARNSSYILTMMGVEPSTNYMYINYRIGPALISTKDALLGSHFQIAQQLSIGMKDLRNVRIGLVLKHFSNAGMTEINTGRNFIGLEVGF